jgi:hypothetical protein
MALFWRGRLKTNYRAVGWGELESPNIYNLQSCLTTKDRSYASCEFIRCESSPLALRTMSLLQTRRPEFHLSF